MGKNFSTIITLLLILIFVISCSSQITNDSGSTTPNIIPPTSTEKKAVIKVSGLQKVWACVSFDGSDSNNADYHKWSYKKSSQTDDMYCQIKVSQNRLDFYFPQAGDYTVKLEIGENVSKTFNLKIIENFSLPTFSSSIKIDFNDSAELILSQELLNLLQGKEPDGTINNPINISHSTLRVCFNSRIYYGWNHLNNQFYGNESGYTSILNGTSANLLGLSMTIPGLKLSVDDVRNVSGGYCIINQVIDYKDVNGIDSKHSFEAYDERRSSYVVITKDMEDNIEIPFYSLNHNWYGNESMPKRVYWTAGEIGNGKINYAEFTNTSKINTIISGLNYKPTIIEVDSENNKIYWVDYTNRSVFKANLEGDNVVTILTAQLDIHDICLDTKKGRIYISDTEKIFITDLNGICLGTFFDKEANKLALDNHRGKLYWTGIQSNVYCKNLDGSVVEQIYTGDAGYDLAYDWFNNYIYFVENNNSTGFRKIAIDNSQISNININMKVSDNFIINNLNCLIYYIKNEGTKSCITQCNRDGTCNKNLFQENNINKNGIAFNY